MANTWVALLVASSEESTSLYYREGYMLLLSGTRNTVTKALLHAFGWAGGCEHAQLLLQIYCWGALMLQPTYLREIWLVNCKWLVKFFAATHFDGTWGPFVLPRQLWQWSRIYIGKGISHRWTFTGKWCKLLGKTWGGMQLPCRLQGWSIHLHIKELALFTWKLSPWTYMLWLTKGDCWWADMRFRMSMQWVLPLSALLCWLF